MRTLDYIKIVDAVQELCEEICYILAEDVVTALQTAARQETIPRAVGILNKLLENARIAKEKYIPLCQDTGLAVVFVEQGSSVTLKPPADNPNATIIDAINQGVAKAWDNALLRKSVVTEPLNQRKNNNSNTPAVVHYTITPGDKIKISIMAKGGGCENKSCFKMFNPTDSKETVIRWILEVVKQAGANACPPLVVGVGMGGSFEQCCLLSKKALLHKLTDAHPDPFYAKLESELLEKINSLGLGPQGLGGDTTALAVHIETAPCHIASLPVAVNIECHAHRHKTITI